MLYQPHGVALGLMPQKLDGVDAAAFSKAFNLVGLFVAHVRCPMTGRCALCPGGRVLTFFAPHWLHCMRCPICGALNEAGGASTFTSAF